MWSAIRSARTRPLCLQTAGCRDSSEEDDKLASLHSIISLGQQQAAKGTQEDRRPASAVARKFRRILVS
jgi:hypothetical protein